METFEKKFKKNKHGAKNLEKISKKINTRPTFEKNFKKNKHGTPDFEKKINPRKFLALLTWAWQFSAAGEPKFRTFDVYGAV